MWRAVEWFFGGMRSVFEMLGWLCLVCGERLARAEKWAWARQVAAAMKRPK
jgi:hypothetical protein